MSRSQAAAPPHHAEGAWKPPPAAVARSAAVRQGSRRAGDDHDTTPLLATAGTRRATIPRHCLQPPTQDRGALRSTPHSAYTSGGAPVANAMASLVVAGLLVGDEAGWVKLQDHHVIDARVGPHVDVEAPAPLQQDAARDEAVHHLRRQQPTRRACGKAHCEARPPRSTATTQHDRHAARPESATCSAVGIKEP